VAICEPYYDAVIKSRCPHYRYLAGFKVPRHAWHRSTAATINRSAAQSDENGALATTTTTLTTTRRLSRGRFFN